MDIWLCRVADDEVKSTDASILTKVVIGDSNTGTGQAIRFRGNVDAKSTPLDPVLIGRHIGDGCIVGSNNQPGHPRIRRASHWITGTVRTV